MTPAASSGEHPRPAQSPQRPVVGVPQWLMGIAVAAFVATSTGAIGTWVEQRERNAADRATAAAQKEAFDEFKEAVNARLDKLGDRMADRFTASQAVALEARLQAQITELRKANK